MARRLRRRGARRQALMRMDCLTAPREKLDCVVECCKARAPRETRRCSPSLK